MHTLTFDSESGFHSSDDVVSHVTVEQPSTWGTSYHLNSLESPGKEVKDISAMHTVRLTYTHTHQTKGK